MHTNNTFRRERKNTSTAYIQIKQKLMIYLDTISSDSETSKLYFITVIAIFKQNSFLINSHNY